MTTPTLESARLDVQRAEHAFRHPKPGIAEEARDQLANLLSQARANLRLVERVEKGEPIRGEIRPITIPSELVDGPLPGDAPAATSGEVDAPACLQCGSIAVAKRGVLRCLNCGAKRPDDWSHPRGATLASGGSSPDGGLILAEGPSFDLRPFARAADSHEQAELLALALRQMVALAGRPGMTMDRLREQLVRAAEGWERLAAKAREALVHRSVAPFTAACGADEPNQRTTQVAANVTCSRCGEGIAGRRRIVIRCGCCDAPWTDGHQCATPCSRHPDHAGREPGPATVSGDGPTLAPEADAQPVPLTAEERDELAKLRRLDQLSSLGDRPQSMAAAKLRRMMELTAREHVKAAPAPIGEYVVVRADGGEVERGSIPAPPPAPPKTATPDDPLELAFWKFDSLKKRKGMPMPDRDAFKAAVRGLMNAARGSGPGDAAPARPCAPGDHSDVCASVGEAARAAGEGAECVSGVEDAPAPDAWGDALPSTDVDTPDDPCCAAFPKSGLIVGRVRWDGNPASVWCRACGAMSVGGSEWRRPTSPRDEAALDACTCYRGCDDADGWHQHADDLCPVPAHAGRMVIRIEARQRPATAAAPDREALGRRVREIWVDFAREQPNPKPHHLLSWDGLDEPNREVDRQIGEQLFAMGSAPALDLARILNELVEYGSHLLLHLGQLAEGHALGTPEAVKAWLDGADLAHAAHFAAQLAAWHGNAREALAPYAAALDAEIDAAARAPMTDAEADRICAEAGIDVAAERQKLLAKIDQAIESAEAKAAVGGEAVQVEPAEGEEPARGDEVVRVAAPQAARPLPLVDDLAGLARREAASAPPVTDCTVQLVTAMVAEARHRAHGYPVPTSPPSGWCNAVLFGALAVEVERLQVQLATMQAQVAAARAAGRASAIVDEGRGRLAEIARDRDDAQRHFESAARAHDALLPRLAKAEAERDEWRGLTRKAVEQRDAAVERAKRSRTEAVEEAVRTVAGALAEGRDVLAEVRALARPAAAEVPAAAPPARLQVGIALISRPRTPDVMESLVQRRPEDASFGAGLWEFPGGKQEERDHGSFACTVVREAWEELAVGGTVEGDRVAAFDLDPPTLPFPIYVEAYRLAIEGEPRPIVASAIEWHTLDEIAGMQATPATARIVDDLRRV